MFTIEPFFPINLRHDDITDVEDVGHDYVGPEGCVYGVRDVEDGVCGSVDVDEPASELDVGDLADDEVADQGVEARLEGDDRHRVPAVVHEPDAGRAYLPLAAVGVVPRPDPSLVQDVSRDHEVPVLEQR